MSGSDNWPQKAVRLTHSRDVELESDGVGDCLEMGDTVRGSEAESEQRARFWRAVIRIGVVRWRKKRRDGGFARRSTAGKERKMRDMAIVS